MKERDGTNKSGATTPKAPSMKENIDKFDFVKIKNVCFVKGTIKNMRRQATEWEKILAKDIADRGHIQNMQRTLKL